MSAHKFIILGISVLFALQANAQKEIYRNDFSNPAFVPEKVGRGECRVDNGVLYTNTAYSLFGDNSWKNYSFSFRARAPKDAEQVQIWAGFRANNRFDRYVVGIKGGLQDDIYLMRLGYMGTDEFLEMRPLGFHPETGEWYKMKVEVCGNRIRVFVGDGSLPHIDFIDKNNNQTATGGVTLGGGWIDTEFDDLVVCELPEDTFEGKKIEESARFATPEEKEGKRKAERAAYKGMALGNLDAVRTEMSLDGDWLFMPGYQMDDRNVAVSPETDDSSWHVMQVPSFWSPIRIWLHGETMGTQKGHQPKGVSDTYYQQETQRCEDYTFDYRKTRSAWYRQWVELPEGVESKNITLQFDAIAKVAEIYVNGESAGTHIGMFGETKIDVSKLMKPGRNLIAVKVIRDYVRGMEDPDRIVDIAVTVPVTNKMLKDLAHGFYGDDPAGIWQPVKLVITSPVKVEDVFIKPALDGAEFELTVNNASTKKSNFSIITDITDKANGSLFHSFTAESKVSLGAGESRTFTFSESGLKPSLWSPQHPNLYDFTFSLCDSKGNVLDSCTITSGFRTFEVKDGLFYLNGVKYWLRGGNHTPFALAPNDKQLADTFFSLMSEAKIDVTRTHTTPWNELWITEADKYGIGISFEGTWPWLMIQSSPIPDGRILGYWREEFLSLLKKYRNHPSIFFWTVNNEMNFYHSDPDPERAGKKFGIISDVVKQMRAIDPTRPVCFDSNYQRRVTQKRFGDDFLATVDDGDMDDVHGYYNWYDYSLFRFFNGEFQQRNKVNGRPLISQEMSTGYPNNETGHPTRSYQIIHQNPFSLIGYQGYDFSNPDYFLNAQAFITGELAEAIRRSCDQGSGMIHFALLTWFRQCYDYRNIEPYPAYYALKRALQPVLVSAEIWGRNLYAGEKLPVRICVVNDLEDGRTLKPTLLRWSLQDESGKVFASGRQELAQVPHYTRLWVEPAISIPASIPADRVNAKLVLKLTEDGICVSENEYKLTVTRRSWPDAAALRGSRIAILDADGMAGVLDGLGIEATKVDNVGRLLAENAALCIISGNNMLGNNDLAALKAYQQKGGKLLLLGCKEDAKNLFPDIIYDWIIPTEGDIVNMERDDAPVFDGLDLMDLRYFNNNRREIPLACNAVLKARRDPRMTELAGQMKIHAYIDGGRPEDRLKKIDSMRGFTMIGIEEGKGGALVSTMCTEKAGTDPIAAKLLVNMIKVMIK